MINRNNNVITPTDIPNVIIIVTELTTSDKTDSCNDVKNTDESRLRTDGMSFII